MQYKQSNLNCRWYKENNIPIPSLMRNVVLKIWALRCKCQNVVVKFFDIALKYNVPNPCRQCQNLDFPLNIQSCEQFTQKKLRTIMAILYYSVSTPLGITLETFLDIGKPNLITHNNTKSNLILCGFSYFYCIYKNMN